MKIQIEKAAKKFFVAAMIFTALSASAPQIVKPGHAHLNDAANIVKPGHQR